MFDESGRPIASSHPPTERLSPASWESLSRSRGPTIEGLPASIANEHKDATLRAAAEWVHAPDGRRFVVLVSWSDMYAQEMLQLLSGVGSLGVAQGGGVAFFAHIGGFVTGLLLIGLFRPSRNTTRGFRRPERYGY